MQEFREQRRDISKYVKSLGSMIALYGIENQSSLDADMVFRVMGYDYASYRSQMEKRGIEYGIEQGMEYGIEALILDNLEEQKSREQILEKLKKRFRLTAEQADVYLERYAGK